MNFHPKLALLALVAGTALALTACGGDEVAQALNLGAPQARFVNAVPGSPALALYRKGELQGSAGSQAYGGASKYYDTVNVTSTWDVRNAADGTELGTTSLRAENATRYTIVALPAAGSMYDLLQISDPYGNAVTSNARVRVVNGAAAAGTMDVYITAPGADLASATPMMTSVGSQSVSPASGTDSDSLAGGLYQLRLATAGTRTVFFSAALAIGDHDDVLLVTLPTGDGAGVKVLDIPSGPNESNADLANTL
jgi:hypothetical protein